MRLYNNHDERLYINAAERPRFIRAANRASPPQRAFGLTLAYTGCRLSEARPLTFNAVQPETGLLSIRSLKKRSEHHVREVPVPTELIAAINALRPEPGCLLWPHDGAPVSRVTAYRWIKALMAAAQISGPQATAKGLRHGFAIHALGAGVQLNMVQKWMGHSSIKTTAIYANAAGPEERAIARRMWSRCAISSFLSRIFTDL